MKVAHTKILNGVEKSQEHEMQNGGVKTCSLVGRQ